MADDESVPGRSVGMRPQDERAVGVFGNEIESLDRLPEGLVEDAWNGGLPRGRTVLSRSYWISSRSLH